MNLVFLHPYRHLAVALLGTTASLGLLVKPAIAQSTYTVDPSQDFSTERSTDPFSGRGSDQINSMFDLIHRANLGNSRSASEFSQEQRQMINSEANDFRTRQLYLLQQQQQASPSGGMIVPPSAPTPVSP